MAIGSRTTFGDADHARGNPTKVAQAILTIAGEKQPPVRLLLGSDAVAGAAAAAAERAHEDARWKALSVPLISTPPESAAPRDSWLSLTSRVAELILRYADHGTTTRHH